MFAQLRGAARARGGAPGAVGAGQPEGRAGSGSAREATGRFRWGTAGSDLCLSRGSVSRCAANRPQEHRSESREAREEPSTPLQVRDVPLRGENV